MSVSLPIQPLSIAAGALTGISDKIIQSHHANNYSGAVKRLNAIRAELAALDFSATPGYRLNGLKREELIALNSARLHELHFASMGGGGKAMVPAMELALKASFGSVQRWRDEFVAMGKALGGGSGWVLLGFSPQDGSLCNQWAADHTHTAAGSAPILALDMYEHAYHMDFGANAAAWVDAFMANIDWAAVYARYQHAVHGVGETFGISSAELKSAMAGPGAPALFDVRRDAVYAQSPNMIAGAQWRDPAEVAQWGASLLHGQPVVVSCVYGHEVGRSTALRLRAMGVDARFLAGGHDGWQKTGLPMAPKD